MHSCLPRSLFPAGQVADLPSPFPGRLPFWASPSLSRLANASGRIEFIILLIMDWSFALRLLPTPPLGDAVSFSYGHPVFCPMGTSTPLLVRTFRRT